MNISHSVVYKSKANRHNLLEFTVHSCTVKANMILIFMTGLILNWFYYRMRESSIPLYGLDVNTSWNGIDKLEAATIIPAVGCQVKCSANCADIA